MKVFPERSLLTSEFAQILDHLRSLCLSGMGQEEVNQMHFSSNPIEIGQWIGRTSEMQQIIASGLPFPATAYQDPGKHLSLLRASNSVLQESQFCELLNFMYTIRDIFSFFKNRKGIYPYLESIIGIVRYEPEIISSIEEILDENCRVRTSASTELARIRRSLQRSRAECDRMYNGIISKYRKQGWLSESEESSRNGRRVIAIQAELKRSLPGVIHDTSATGKTSFLEPEEAMGINNTIASLEYEEQAEIRRILKELTAQIRKFASVILTYRTQLGCVDFNRAKALFSIGIDGKVPRLISEPVIDLKRACHPLLLLHNKKSKKDTIPFDLLLNRQNRILVISGPNAGGKTVCMKTCGLLQMMLQSGMTVSASDDSTFGIFEHLFIDIGDSQSIEYELSTYSSRLRHMKSFLDEVNDHSLFLIDEFGTGTDPNLGGALAEAVLEELNNRNATGIITTHYLNLKVMADRTPGIINGSMEFDLKRLRPLYRLMVGKPGSSYTFLVAERSGLPKDVIQSAKRKVSGKSLRLEKLLTELETDRELLHARLTDAAKKDRQLRELTRQHEELMRTLQNNYTSKENRVRKNEERMTRETEERFRNFLKEWKKAKDKKPVIDKYQKLFVKTKKKEDPKVIERKRQEKLSAMKSILKEGMAVRLENGSTKGIIEQIDDDKARVIFGQFRTVCELSSLEPFDVQNDVKSSEKPNKK